MRTDRRAVSGAVVALVLIVLLEAAGIAYVYVQSSSQINSLKSEVASQGGGSTVTVTETATQSGSGGTVTDILTTTTESTG